MKNIYLLTVSFLLFQTAHAQNTAIPDQNFEQALIDQSYDNAIDGQVLTANISGVTYLEVYSRGIQDLTGIQDFASLEVLDADDNLLTSIDISQNSNLEILYIGNNPLAALDASNNTNLVNIFAYFTNLSSLNTSNNINLLFLSLWGSNVTSLDLTNNTLLEFLDVDENDLTQLDLSNNPNLEALYCLDNNNLSFINLKNGNTAGLSELIALNLANNACIQVDDAQAATNANTTPYNQWTVDSSSTFSENCSLSTISLTNEKLRFFPNPTTDKITILNANITSYEVYDAKGSAVITNTKFNGNTIEVASLKPGIYFIKAYNDTNQNQNIRFIKK